MIHKCGLTLMTVGTWQEVDGAAVEAGEQSISFEMPCDVGHTA